MRGKAAAGAAGAGAAAARVAAPPPESAASVLQTVLSSERGRALRLLQQREKRLQAGRERLAESEAAAAARVLPIAEKYAGGEDAGETVFRATTVGLLSAEGFRAKRRQLEEGEGAPAPAGAAPAPAAAAAPFRERLRAAKRLLSFQDPSEGDNSHDLSASAGIEPGTSCFSNRAGTSCFSNEGFGTRGGAEEGDGSRAAFVSGSAESSTDGRGAPAVAEIEAGEKSEHVFREAASSAVCHAGGRGGAPAAVGPEGLCGGPGAPGNPATWAVASEGASALAAAAGEAPPPPARGGVRRDPSVNTALLPDRARLAELRRAAEARQAARREAVARAKNEQLEIVYSYWDGAGHRRSAAVKKGDSVARFLQRVIDDLEVEFASLRVTTPADLMFVKEDLILPPSVTFWELIESNAQGRSGPLFRFSVDDPVGPADPRRAGMTAHAGKVVTKRWYERNQHVFPASKWRLYTPPDATGDGRRFL